MNEVLDLKTPKWAKPLLKQSRYKAAWGGRSGGKSHFFAERCVEELICNPNTQIVCIREIQKSLKYSAKLLIESKIRQMAPELFTITQSEIRRNGGNGFIIFQGMQDHTAETIKSLESFDIAWVEEAQSLSQKSLTMLRPTIRKQGSEIWFSWNPDQPEDAVDHFFRGKGAPDNTIIVKVNSGDNPFLPETARLERESDRKRMEPETFAHVWEGEYNVKSDAIVFANKYRIDDFDTGALGDPLHGMDFGFANDPTCAVRCYVKDNRLYIRNEAGRVKLELDDTADYFIQRIPAISKFTIRADSARPESISYLKRKGLPKIKGVKKWQGSVEDGIEHMKSYDEIIIHPDCEKTIQEFRLYSYKIDKRSGDVLPIVVDANNHYIDAIRYALVPLMRNRTILKPEMISI